MKHKVIIVGTGPAGLTAAIMGPALMDNMCK